MRLVAVAIPLLLLVSALPAATADDECARASSVCTPLTTRSVDGVPPAAQKSYYVFLGALTCPPTSNACHASPPAKVIGLVWEETNGLEGLQRRVSATPSGQKAPDTVLLV